MQISEFTKPITAKALNESLAKRFGKKINLSSFTLEQLQDARNKLRTQLFNVETNESFDSVQNASYQKSRLMLDVLNAEISERGDIEGDIVEADHNKRPDSPDLDNDGDTEEPISQAAKQAKNKKEKKPVKEGAEDHAELVMAAKDMVDRLTGWMEDTAEMQTESMLELADAIRDELGAEQAEGFTNTIKPALDSLYSAMESARQSLTSGVGMLTGEQQAPMMGADDDMDMDMDMEPTDDMDMDDDFGAAEPAAGGVEPEERAKRESVERVVRKIKKESVNPRNLAKTLSKKK